MNTLLEKESTEEAYKKIPGWGMDADEENDPTYPMKNWTGDDHKRIQYTRPPLQNDAAEILHSNERPTVSAVFGTSTPPSGLSGMLRRYAFKYSENSWGHWLPLILADRVNMIEGIFSDIGHGHLPNVLKERGWSAEWKYNRKGAIKKTAITVGVVSALTLFTIYLLRKSKR